MKNKELVVFFAFIIFNLNSYDSSNTEKVFTEIYKNNFWADAIGGATLKPDASISGNGSNLISTAKIRKEIPQLLKKYNIQIMLDAPCGDFFWMRYIISQLGSIRYIGIDIVDDLIKRNKSLYKNNEIEFLHLDLIKDSLPCVDLVLCRDCLVHFSYNDVVLTIQNLKESGSKYILMTHFNWVKDRKFQDITTGDWHPVNFTLPPFNFPNPLELVIENCPQLGFPDKCLALWKLEDLK